MHSTIPWCHAYSLVHAYTQFTAINGGREYQMLDGSVLSVMARQLSADPWTRTETPIQLWKWVISRGKLKLSLAFHSFKPRQALASRSFWTDYTELSETLVINVQVVSWQPSLKACTHQTVIIWKGQRWLKLLTQSASHANACREAKIWWARQVPQKPFP